MKRAEAEAALRERQDELPERSMVELALARAWAIEHAVWHALDDCEHRAPSEVVITRPHYDSLSRLLTVEHPTRPPSKRLLGRALQAYSARYLRFWLEEWIGRLRENANTRPARRRRAAKETLTP